TFHLRMETTRESKMMRIDYKPLGDDFETIILDYTHGIKYIIDRRVGSCTITQGLDFQSLDIVKNPIEFFIKYEQYIISNDPKNKIYQFNGLRPCRGGAIECVIVTTSFENFPELPETEETWDATNAEWAWSQRNPMSPPPPCQTPPCTKRFDYPVHLLLK
ncbi:unnamed protein product, partial [Didymodactylos carnosus]